MEQDNPISSLTVVPDKYPILSERRVVAEAPPLDYYRTAIHSQEDANLNMIRYYAGLQVDMRRKYRHFHIVHTEPDSPRVQQWREEIHTIANVITPAQCIDELRKQGEESMFDFHERNMPGNKGKNWTELPVAMEGVQKTMTW